MLEIARSLLLEPKLMLIDEPSIGLSPIMVNELFAILTEMRDRGITVLLIEQNAKRALEILRLRHRAGARPHPHRRHRAQRSWPTRASGSCSSAAGCRRRWRSCQPVIPGIARAARNPNHPVRARASFASYGGAPQDEDPKKV